ncbi:hypothetical protein BKA69DRAFT_1167900 [Paraphysoderma sedebokerense]|nr:hypothetical protein BKA69DRAFT_1167900 [Paraphysoderma sedebokerense]
MSTDSPPKLKGQLSEFFPGPFTSDSGHEVFTTCSGDIDCKAKKPEKERCNSLFTCRRQNCESEVGSFEDLMGFELVEAGLKIDNKKVMKAEKDYFENEVSRNIIIDLADQIQSCSFTKCRSEYLQCHGLFCANLTTPILNGNLTITPFNPSSPLFQSSDFRLLSPSNNTTNLTISKPPETWITLGVCSISPVLKTPCPSSNLHPDFNLISLYGSPLPRRFYNHSFCDSDQFKPSSVLTETCTTDSQCLFGICSKSTQKCAPHYLSPATPPESAPIWNTLGGVSQFLIMLLVIVGTFWFIRIARRRQQRRNNEDGDILGPRNGYGGDEMRSFGIDRIDSVMTLPRYEGREGATSAATTDRIESWECSELPPSYEDVVGQTTGSDSEETVQIELQFPAAELTEIDVSNDHTQETVSPDDDDRSIEQVS